MYVESANRDFLVGVISDTHSLLRLQVHKIFKNCDFIIHAGDIGDPQIINDLKKIAHTIAIRGNTDVGYVIKNLPEYIKIEVNGVYFYIIHDLNTFSIENVDIEIKVVISGHTHKPKIFEYNDVLYINPGSAGYYRYGCPITVGLLNVRNRNIDAKIIDIDI